jgi:hypothetical protein
MTQFLSLSHFFVYALGRQTPRNIIGHASEDSTPRASKVHVKSKIGVILALRQSNRNVESFKRISPRPNTSRERRSLALRILQKLCARAFRRLAEIDGLDTAQHRARTERALNEKTPENPGFSAVFAAFSKGEGYPQGDSNKRQIPQENRDNLKAALQNPMHVLAILLAPTLASSF